MAYTEQQVKDLYNSYLGGATPTGADLNYWMNYGGSNLTQGFTDAAQNDPRWGTTGGTTTTTTGGLGGSGGNQPTTQGMTTEQMNSALTGALSPVTQGITGLGTNMNTGFNNLNNNLSTGFGTVNQNLGTLSNNIGTGFQSLNTANDQRALAQTNQATDYFNQLKGLSGGLKDQLTGLGSNMTTYYDDLAKTGAGIQGAVDTVGSDLTGLQNDFTRRTNLADQKRSEILDSVAGTAANTKQALTQGFNQVGNQISGLGGNPSQPQGQQTQQQQSQGNFQTALSNARNAISNPQNLNPAMGMQLSEFVSAFDQSGQFVPQGPDMNGVMTFRSLSPDGQMQIAKQGQQGMQMVGAININQLIQMLGGQV